MNPLKFCVVGSVVYACVGAYMRRLDVKGLLKLMSTLLF